MVIQSRTSLWWTTSTERARAFTVRALLSIHLTALSTFASTAETSGQSSRQKTLGPHTVVIIGPAQIARLETLGAMMYQELSRVTGSLGSFRQCRILFFSESLPLSIPMPRSIFYNDYSAIIPQVSHRRVGGYSSPKYRSRCAGTVSYNSCARNVRSLLEPIQKPQSQSINRLDRRPALPRRYP